MPSRCLATTVCVWPIMAFRPATIASKNQDIDSRPILTFRASPMIPKATKRKPRYWQIRPINAHLLISAITCSRFLKGWFSTLFSMMNIASLHSPQYRDESNCLSEFSYNPSAKPKTGLKTNKTEIFNLHSNRSHTRDSKMSEAMEKVKECAIQVSEELHCDFDETEPTAAVSRPSLRRTQFSAFLTCRIENSC